MSRRAAWAAALALAAALLGGCAAERPKPTPLETYAPKASAHLVWSQRLGKLDFPLEPAAGVGQVIVAASAGTVIALALDNGAELWRASAGAALSAGVGSDGRFASVVTRRNEVVTFEQGREVWRKRVPSSVVTPPFVAGERVFVMGVDRVVHAFDALDGRRLWTLQRAGDALTLALPGVLAAYHDTLLVGQGPQLVGVDPLRGSVRWSVPLASPRGTNEVERLADLVGPPARHGERICARAFQSAVGCADAARASVLWTRNTGGVQPVAVDAERVYGADAVDRITAWRADNGDVAWSSERMLNRGLSGPLAVGAFVVFGDSEGYLHFLAAASGEPQLRLATDGSPVLGAPQLAGRTMLVVTRAGGVFALRQN
ncbi:MAG TPA: outer membrane protein assembly factor BamB [Rubrivivax sp.]|nr:outer membrane protein assembly factor BamB [Rubrivivax sp.]